MKAETRSFYQGAVERAAHRVMSALDEALDLEALAREAALSPFHFHRIFRGMIGETPLELQRRLRLERAAASLRDGASAVTAIAFAAGYETHEAFTRAFRSAFGCAPSAFRAAARTARDPASCTRPIAATLTSRAGLHYTGTGPLPVIQFLSGATTMHVTIDQMPALRIACVRHVGPYNRISDAFARLGQIAGRAGLYAHPGAMMLGIYHDDPESVAPEQLRSDAGITIPEGVPLPEGLAEARIAAGAYAHTTHVGPYDGLGDAWSRLMGEWLPASGRRVGAGEAFEVYPNSQMNTPTAELRTELYLPLA